MDAPPDDTLPAADGPTATTLPARLAEALRFAKSEIGAIGAILVASLAAMAFLSVADEVGEGGTAKVDHAIMFALRQPGNPRLTIGPKWLDIGAMDVTALGSVTILTLIVILVCGLFFTLRRKRYAAWLLAAVLGGTALTQVIKLIYERPRPPLYLHAVEVTNASFPSGHATLSAVTYLTLGALIARFSKIPDVKSYVMGAAVLLTLLVGCSRVYLGVHWPTDVLAGWCLGAAWATACWLAAWALGRRLGRKLGEEEAVEPSS